MLILPFEDRITNTIAHALQKRL